MDTKKITQVLVIQYNDKNVILRQNAQIKYATVIDNCIKNFKIDKKRINEYALLYTNIESKTVKEINCDNKLHEIFKLDLNDKDQNGAYLYSATLRFELRKHNSPSPIQQSEYEYDNELKYILLKQEIIIMFFL